MRPTKVTDLVRAWVLGRAGAFKLSRGRSVPCWSYAAIVANLERARGIRISRTLAWRILWQWDPGLARRRAAHMLAPWRAKKKPAMPSAEAIRKAFELGLDQWNARARALARRPAAPARTLREIFRDRRRALKNSPRS